MTVSALAIRLPTTMWTSPGSSCAVAPCASPRGTSSQHCPRTWSLRQHSQAGVKILGPDENRKYFSWKTTIQHNAIQYNAGWNLINIDPMLPKTSKQGLYQKGSCLHRPASSMWCWTFPPDCESQLGIIMPFNFKFFNSYFSFSTYIARICRSPPLIEDYWHKYTYIHLHIRLYM